MATYYHLAPVPAWEAAEASSGLYKPATYDADGFTHLTADPALLLSVANTFYKDSPDAWICVALDGAALGAEVKLEPAAPVGEKQPGTFGKSTDDVPLFPHLYGPIPVSAATKKHAVSRAGDGSFTAIEGLA